MDKDETVNNKVTVRFFVAFQHLLPVILWAYLHINKQIIFISKCVDTFKNLNYYQLKCNIFQKCMVWPVRPVA